MRRSRQGAVMVVALCANQLFEATTTNGTMYVVSEEFDFGPAIEDLVAHAEGQDFETDFGYKVGFQYKLDGSWGSVVVLEGAVGAFLGTTTYTISDAYDTRTTFGLRMRFVILAGLTAGSTLQRGRITASMAVRFLT